MFHILTNFFLVLVFLVGVWRYLIMILIYIFSDKDLCWKPFHMLIKYLNILFCVLPTQVFDCFKKLGRFLLLICENSLYILDLSSFLDICLADFPSTVIFLTEHKFLMLICPFYRVFSFLLMLFVMLRNISLLKMMKNCSCVFFLKLYCFTFCI